MKFSDLSKKHGIITLILSSTFLLACQQPNNTLNPNSTNVEYTAPIPQIATFDGNLDITIPKSINLNNLNATDIAQNSIGPGMAYSRLVNLKSDPATPRPSMILECDICTNWNYRSSNKLTFKIKDNIYWHDGTKLSPEHVKNHYSQQIKNDDHHLSQSGIKSVVVNSSSDIEFNLEHFDSDLLLKLAHSKNKILNPELWSGGLNDDNSTPKIIGTGPWMHFNQDNVAADSITFIRNPVYFSHKKPFSQSITINYVEYLDKNKTTALLQSGHSNIIYSNTDVELEAYGNQYNSITSPLSYGGPSLFFNLSKESMGSLQKRRNIFLLLDPWQHNRKSNIHESSVSIGIPAGGKDYTSDQIALRKQYFDDPVSAQLGTPENNQNKELKIGISHVSYPYQSVLDLIIKDIDSSKYEVTRYSLSSENYIKELSNSKSDFDILVGLAPPSQFANEFLLSTLHSDGEFSFSNYSDSTLNNMIESQVNEKDTQLRQSGIRDIQTYVLDQAYMYNSAPLQHKWIYDNSVRNFFPNDNLGEYLYWANVWID